MSNTNGSSQGIVNTLEDVPYLKKKLVFSTPNIAQKFILTHFFVIADNKHSISVIQTSFIHLLMVD